MKKNKASCSITFALNVIQQTSENSQSDKATENPIATLTSSTLTSSNE